MNKNNYIWDIAILLLGFALLLLIAVGDLRKQPAEAVEIAECPIEDKLVTAAVLDAAYTAEAQIVVGYDWDYVCRVVMAEAGGEDDDSILAVCQAIQNTACRTLLNPEEVVRLYGYTQPAETATERVRKACERVFLLGYTYEPIKDAELFYSVRSDFYSAWHEQYDFVTQVGDIKFFGGYDDGLSATSMSARLPNA